MTDTPDDLGNRLGADIRDIDSHLARLSAALVLATGSQESSPIDPEAGDAVDAIAWEVGLSEFLVVIDLRIRPVDVPAAEAVRNARVALWHLGSLDDAQTLGAAVPFLETARSALVAARERLIDIVTAHG